MQRNQFLNIPVYNIPVSQLILYYLLVQMTVIPSFLQVKKIYVQITFLFVHRYSNSMAVYKWHMCTSFLVAVRCAVPTARMGTDARKTAATVLTASVTLRLESVCVTRVSMGSSELSF